MNMLLNTFMNILIIFVLGLGTIVLLLNFACAFYNLKKKNYLMGSFNLSTGLFLFSSLVNLFYSKFIL